MNSNIPNFSRFSTYTSRASKYAVHIFGLSAGLSFQILMHMRPGIEAKDWANDVNSHTLQRYQDTKSEWGPAICIFN